MINAIIRFCVRERLIVLLLTAVVIAAGWYSTRNVPIDAIPDIGENQVIVFTAWPGRSPKDVEDQITYPLSVALLAVPEAESVRGKSLFGYSFVQVTFSDDTDFYWARSRVAEQLGTAAASLPEGVVPTLGPDATGLGQVLYYVLEPPPGMNLAELRSLQDFVVKYELQAVRGVSEVASVGGYVRQYQVEVDPNRLRFHDIPIDRLIQAIRNSNIDVGARTIESGGMEFIIRGRGFIGSEQDPVQAIEDIEETVILSRNGIPVRIRDLGHVQLGPDFRRGAIDLNGTEAVGGVVVMRYGENPRAVIERVKEKIRRIEPSLQGVTVRIVYDRSGLIDETIATLTTALSQQVMITAVVILLFLLHVRASLVVAVTLPIAVLMAFIGMDLFGVNANIMSLAGIAIAIGTMVDHGHHRLGDDLRSPRRVGERRTSRRRGTATVDHSRGRGRGGPRSRDRRDHNRRQLPAGLHADRAGLQAVRPARVDENVLTDRRPHRCRHTRPAPEPDAAHVESSATANAARRLRRIRCSACRNRLVDLGRNRCETAATLPPGPDAHCRGGRSGPRLLDAQ